MVRLFDLKTGQKRNYRPQMAFYALGLMQKYNERKCEVHLVYSKYKDADVYTITREEAEDVVFRIVDSVKSPDKKETPCDYCNWCSRRGKCSALTEMVKIIIKEDFDCEDMGRKLDAATKAAAWAEGVKRDALAAARDGEVPEGYTLVSKAVGENKTTTYLRKGKRDA
tara:strand:- start:10877 stop:11380 length:504 start_codon:yes stop_codon:yes gene_type:complete